MAPPPEPESERESEAEAEESKVPRIRKRSKKWAMEQPWKNTEETTIMYQILEKNDLKSLSQYLAQSPDAVHMRYGTRPLKDAAPLSVFTH